MNAARSTSSADRFAKTAASRRKHSPSEDAPAVRPIGSTATRTKLVRSTIDLTPTDHRRLSRIADRLAEELDATEVPRRSVWLALLAELDDDGELYARVRERIRVEREEG